ncbi:MAG TPA: hypothetical protein DCS07_09950 [Bdellovibrionales bacterium]|nr:MAG: hypothetical protein A2Z97_04390 [Bdellovibrionales bacterium GWB1_52_6]OFZ02719.1 MAG: hypothetical protein A2X97_12310 [Bdellovibrionales bacterium GWA1_52_35]OFZ39751.1 MAG: hypothetical protein A2070_00990 [Bdellovibrionales bacterium GWC1_52_8]HAR42935.1 hypothetical protein [Bdellovibrionales bacterium]
MVIVLALGCTTIAVTPTGETVALQRMSLRFGTMNEKVYGDVLLTSGQGFRRFDLNRYRQILGQYHEDAAGEIRETLNDFEIQELNAFDKTFVICVYSSKHKLAMCDDPRCSGVEKWKSVPTSQVLVDWKKELPLGTCPHR